MIIHVDVDIPYRHCKLLLKCNWVDMYLFKTCSVKENFEFNNKNNIDISWGSPLRSEYVLVVLFCLKHA